MSPQPVTWSDDEAAGVIEVIINRWPGGVANKGWELDLLQGYVGEMQFDGLPAKWALIGLRACESGFIPTVGQVRGLAREAKGPLTSAELAEAEERFVVERAAAAAARLAAAYAALPKEIDRS